MPAMSQVSNPGEGNIDRMGVVAVGEGIETIGLSVPALSDMPAQQDDGLPGVVSLRQ
jgi:hypothetical protein